MTRRSLPLTIAVAVLALVLGSVGTAVAGTLTPKTVKKIAAKVVTQKAKKLSVAHATTADKATTAADASQLGGRSPSAYLHQAYTVEIPGASSVTGLSLALPAVPSGTYLVNLSESAQLTTPGGWVDCQLRSGATTVLVGDGSESGLLQRAIDASGLLTVTTPLSLSCEGVASGTMTFPYPGLPTGRVVFTRVDVTTDLGSAAEH